MLYTHTHTNTSVPLLLAYSCGTESGFRCLRPFHSARGTKGKLEPDLVQSRKQQFFSIPTCTSPLPLSKPAACYMIGTLSQLCPRSPVPGLGTDSDVMFSESSLEAQSNPCQMHCHTPVIKTMDLCAILMLSSPDHISLPYIYIQRLSPGWINSELNSGLSVCCMFPCIRHARKIISGHVLTQ